MPEKRYYIYIDIIERAAGRAGPFSKAVHAHETRRKLQKVESREEKSAATQLTLLLDAYKTNCRQRTDYRDEQLVNASREHFSNLLGVSVLV